MGKILLKGITLNGCPSDIRISGKRIERISQAGQIVAPEGYEVMDCTGKVAIPGFINMHTHAAMTLMRGVGEDMQFHEWLSRIWELENDINDEFIYWGSKIAALEMIKTGTTTFNDQYFIIPQTIKACAEMGIRPVMGFVLLDQNDKELCAKKKADCVEFYDKYLKQTDEQRFSVCIHAVYSVSEPLMVWGADFARKNGLLIHTHLSETQKEVEDCKAAHGGLTPVEYYDKLGILGPDVIAAHTLWLSEHDIELLAERKVTCVHNINSNAKLSSGYRFLYNEMRAAGVNLCIGTDGCASSNNLDILEAMKTSAIIQKAWRQDPSSMPLPELLDMATINGARALGIETGAIKEGMLADISIVDTDNTFFLSPAPFLANLVYSAHSDCIDSVICNGEFVMKHRAVPGEKEILEGAREYLSKKLARQ